MGFIHLICKVCKNVHQANEGEKQKQSTETSHEYLNQDKKKSHEKPRDAQNELLQEKPRDAQNESLQEKPRDAQNESSQEMALATSQNITNQSTHKRKRSYDGTIYETDEEDMNKRTNKNDTVYRSDDDDNSSLKKYKKMRKLLRFR
jgi:hypothetical protein